MEREKLKSRLGFILLSAGCAIGIGNVWKFPYIAGQGGGGAFVLFYLIFLCLQAHLGAFLDSSAQNVASADGGDVQLGADNLGLSALTSTRCAQQDQIHRTIPFLC